VAADERPGILRQIVSGARSRPLPCAAAFVVPVAVVLAVSLAIRTEYRATAVLAYRFPTVDSDAVRLWGLRPVGVRSGFYLPDPVLTPRVAPAGAHLGPVERVASQRGLLPSTRTVTAVAGDSDEARRRANQLAHATIDLRARVITREAARTSARAPRARRELALLAGIERANVVVLKSAGPAVASRHQRRNVVVAVAIGLWLAAATGLLLGRTNGGLRSRRPKP
jgi:hypothetical protein